MTFEGTLCFKFCTFPWLCVTWLFQNKTIVVSINYILYGNELRRVVFSGTAQVTPRCNVGFGGEYEVFVTPPPHTHTPVFKQRGKVGTCQNLQVSLSVGEVNGHTRKHLQREVGHQFGVCLHCSVFLLQRLCSTHEKQLRQAKTAVGQVWRKSADNVSWFAAPQNCACNSVRDPGTGCSAAQNFHLWKKHVAPQICG